MKGGDRTSHGSIVETDPQLFGIHRSIIHKLNCLVETRLSFNELGVPGIQRPQNMSEGAPDYIIVEAVVRKTLILYTMHFFLQFRSR